MHSSNAGMNWEQGFCEGLIKSKIFVPLLSKKAIKAPFENIEMLFDIGYTVLIEMFWFIYSFRLYCVCVRREVMSRRRRDENKENSSITRRKKA